MLLSPKEGLHTDSVLLDLAKAQEDAASSLPWKCWSFLSSAWGYNRLEQHILATERNDCAFVAKYSRVVKLDLAARAEISVDSLALHAIHAPHPLVNFAKDEPLLPQLVQEVEESPAVVFVHGMGGQMSQFEPLMGLLSQCLELFALDLPGFGDSRWDFPAGHRLAADDRLAISRSVQAMAWLDFRTDAIVAVVEEFVRQCVPAAKKVLLVGHSMGTHLLIKTANALDAQKVEGLVLLSPPPLLDEAGWQLPSASLAQRCVHHRWVVDQMRMWDRVAGLNSPSVLRQLPRSCSPYTKARQLRWNVDVDTRAVLRYMDGFQRATFAELAAAVARYNDNPADTNVYEKTLLVGGVEDAVTPVRVVHEIHARLTEHFGRTVSHVTTVNGAGHSVLLAKPEFISGIILNQLELKFPPRLHLSPAWVLRLKAEISGDKWGLKNELKWLQTQAVSHNIVRANEPAPLLGMKTLREGDPHHLPQVLEAKFYGPLRDGSLRGTLIAVVDISADIPPYSPQSLSHVQYYKCATVSKVVPDHNAIRRFIQLVDDILASASEPEPLVGIHCHYGFNRTGFLICCYLVEKRGWSVREAVEGFGAAKPPGIKHPHFVDALYVRYEL